MTEQEFKSNKGRFVYKGVYVTPIVGGYYVFETNQIKASNKQEVDDIINSGYQAIEKAISR